MLQDGRPFVVGLSDDAGGANVLGLSSKLAHAGLQSAHHVPEEQPGYAQKTYERSVSRETSHVPIAPYVAAAAILSVHHASRADSSAARSCGSARALRQV